MPEGLRILIRGSIMGLSIAAPVGPIGVLCIRRTIANGRLSGLLSGLGAATADLLYGVVAALGLSALSSFLVGNRLWIALAGGAILIWLGGSTLAAKPAREAAPAAHSSLIVDYLTTVGLTLTNPMTILFFVGVIATLPATTSSALPADALWLVCGVFTGSAVWWLVLSTAAGFIPFTPRLRRLINGVSGLVLIGFGIWTPISALIHRG